MSLKVWYAFTLGSLTAVETLSKESCKRISLSASDYSNALLTYSDLAAA